MHVAVFTLNFFGRDLFATPAVNSTTPQQTPWQTNVTCRSVIETQRRYAQRELDPCTESAGFEELTCAANLEGWPI